MRDERVMVIGRLVKERQAMMVQDRNRREQIGERRRGEKEDRHGNRNDF